MTLKPMTRRRAFRTMTVVIPAILAGCYSIGKRIETIPTTRLSMTATSDAALTSNVLSSVEINDETESRLLEEGATVEVKGRPPVPVEKHFLSDGTVYRVSAEVTERTPATWYEVTVNPVQGSVDASETVRVANLPTVDREKLADHGMTDDRPVGVGTGFVYTEAERERSVLVSDPNYSVLLWDDGARARWNVLDSGETEVTTARYTAERVASAAEYGRRMREQFAIALTDLSASQRNIVETAIAEEEYVVKQDESPSVALVRLVDQFRGQEALHALDETGESLRKPDLGEPDEFALQGDCVVEYGGSFYLTVILVRGEEFRTETPVGRQAL